ncbi:glycoside hydrolase family 18 protein [Diplogelasinospora grovesii]|uniref:chitinase n=1 Tax=Diplogelasinospora grovesii TaxID=303347 RepID=A0AAN6S042_9PEZI|nr:glycoside hydrolase family 18 protein [Diplogelasinospora grovesii]
MVSSTLLAFGGLFVSLPQALAGFSSTATNNIAIYWGQNSYNQAGSQQRLSYYCSNTDLDIIPLAFLYGIKSLQLNFASASDSCSTFAGTTLLDCPQIEADIQTCQSMGKTILLSVGGATYSEGGFSSAAEAQQWANTLWAMFGPVQSGSSVNRPFGNAVVDGFDFDFESTVQNMAPFAAQMRANMDAATGKQYFLSAAPQCPYPDAADNDMLVAVPFDIVWVQFYNNYCGVSSFVPGAATQNNFNFGTWDNWAKTVSKNPNVKVMLGIPGNTGGGAGYVSGSQLASVISYSQQYSSFGGVMMWDMSQVWANSGFLSQVASDLGSSGSTPPPVTTTTAQPTSTTMVTSVIKATTTTTGTSPTGTLVPQWGQCGGQGYTGSTQCQPPYTCVATGAWWSQCQ